MRLLLIIFATALAAPFFSGSGDTLAALQSIEYRAMPLVPLGVAAAIVIACGDIDLSPAGMFAFLGMLTLGLTNLGLPSWLVSMAVLITESTTRSSRSTSHRSRRVVSVQRRDQVMADIHVIAVGERCFIQILNRTNIEQACALLETLFEEQPLPCLDIYPTEIGTILVVDVLRPIPPREERHNDD